MLCVKVSWFVCKTGSDPFCSTCLFSRHVYLQLLYPWNGFRRYCLSKEKGHKRRSAQLCRHKTGQRLIVRIEPLIEEIIKRYEPSVRNSPYLFPIITSNDPEEAFRQYQTALGYHNRKLKKLGKLTGEDLRLSSYTAKHSWATVARNHNVPLSVISAGMGHTSEKTTLIYLESVENSQIDKANEGILEALCCNVSK